MGKVVKKLLGMTEDDEKLVLIPRKVMEEKKLVDSFTGYGEDYYKHGMFSHLMKKYTYSSVATWRAMHSETKKGSPAADRFYFLNGDEPKDLLEDLKNKKGW